MKISSKIVGSCVASFLVAVSAVAAQAQASLLMSNIPGMTDVSGINTNDLGSFLRTGGLSATNDLLDLGVDLSFFDTPTGASILNLVGQNVTPGKAMSIFTSTKSGEEWIKANPEMYLLLNAALNDRNEPFKLNPSKSVEDYRRGLRASFVSDVGANPLTDKGFAKTQANAQAIALATQANKQLGAAQVESTKQSMDLTRTMLSNNSQISARTVAEIQEVKNTGAANTALLKTIFEQRQEDKRSAMNEEARRIQQQLNSSGAAFGLVRTYEKGLFGAPENAQDLLPADLKK